MRGLDLLPSSCGHVEGEGDAMRCGECTVWRCKVRACRGVGVCVCACMSVRVTVRVSVRVVMVG